MKMLVDWIKKKLFCDASSRVFLLSELLIFKKLLHELIV